MAQRLKSKKSKPTSETPPYGKFVRWLWALFLIGILALATFFFILSKTDLPSFDELENPDFELATSLFAAKGELLGRYYIENRVPVPYEKLNPHLVHALLSTEDKRYYDHAGVDFRALMRVVIKTAILQQKSSGGGSTITQQLAKLLYTDRPARNLMERSLQKFKEWITAVKLEKSYTKEEIMSMYLNEFDFINGAHGIQSAAETYFGKNQEELGVHEAALLIGMLKNPSLYRPDRFPENAKMRRNTVLRLMSNADYIEKDFRDSLMEISVDVSKFKRASHIDGIAPYLRAEMAKDLRKILSDEPYFKPDGTKYDIYRDGLKVYTTIDYKMQEIAEKTMLDHMDETQKRYFKEWKKKDPWTYDDDKIPVELKEDAFDQLLKSTERYQSMLKSTFADEIQAIQESSEAELRGVDLSRMLKADKNPGEITRLLSQKLIGRGLAERYTEILKSKAWKTMVSRWSDFEKRVDEAFNTKVKMQIFSYDKAMQRDTTMSPIDSLKYHRMHLQTGVVAINPRNGHVKVWIGGVNHKYYKYDHVRTDRQVGSTFKPFVYAAAIFFKGISPCFKVEDVPYTITPGEGNFHLAKPWTPKNARGEYTRESRTLYECLRTSMNTASVYLMKQLGDTRAVRDLLDNMGIDKNEKRSDGEYRIPDQPSICLGAADLTVMEMTAAYATFANNGVYNKPFVIQRIEDKNGNVIFHETPEEQVVLDPKRNYVMVDMLKYAASTAGGFSGVKSDFGGKTGTTNDHTDGWFMGITPDLVVGTWVGGEDKWIRFLSFANGQGSRMARPFFSEFLKALESTPGVDYDASLRFERPAEDLGIEIDCEVYERNNPTKVRQEGDENFFKDDFEEDFDDEF
jgi:penicillin-binding protein 1A